MMPKSILWGVCIALCFIFSNCSSQTPPVAATETTPSVIAARNKAMTQRYYSQFSDHNPESPKCFAADFVDRIDPTIKGPEHIKIFNETMYKTWPDVKVTVEQIVGEGDWVMARCTATATHTNEVMGVKPTNKKVEITHWVVHHYNKDGLIIESWGMNDNAALMQQLGLLPSKK